MIETVNITTLNALYRQYCESLDNTDPEEEYSTDRGFAERHVGGFLDWLEEKQTGTKPQPDIVVRCHRDKISPEAVKRMRSAR